MILFEELFLLYSHETFIRNVCTNTILFQFKIFQIYMSLPNLIKLLHVQIFEPHVFYLFFYMLFNGRTHKSSIISYLYQSTTIKFKVIHHLKFSLRIF
jgi:hypothetical protein